MPKIALRIGELAARSGRSVHTIRWYEAQGLLPTVPRDAGGRRVYSTRHVEWLDLMERLRRSGMSVADLRQYTRLAQQGAATLGATCAMLEEHRETVQAQIAEWQQALRLIDEKAAFYRRWQKTGERPASRPHKTAVSERKRPLQRASAR